MEFIEHLLWQTYMVLPEQSGKEVLIYKYKS